MLRLPFLFVLYLPLGYKFLVMQLSELRDLIFIAACKKWPLGSVKDIADVTFESVVSFLASLSEEQLKQLKDEINGRH